MADTARARKLADRIHEIVAEALEKRIKDPRLGFITVTDTRVTGDLQHATVFYTVLGDAEERVASAAALESAKGVLRSEVGRRTGVRLTPTLEFIADAVPENAAHIEDLLRVAAARDADVAALAAGASYAGDPDPYRHDDVDGDGDGADGGADGDLERDGLDGDGADGADGADGGVDGAGTAPVGSDDPVPVRGERA
jgi:ribosome-binding factor A